MRYPRLAPVLIWLCLAGGGARADDEPTPDDVADVAPIVAPLAGPEDSSARISSEIDKNRRGERKKKTPSRAKKSNMKPVKVGPRDVGTTDNVESDFPVATPRPPEPRSTAPGLLSTAERELALGALRAAEDGRWDRARQLARAVKEPLFARIVDWLWLQRPGTGAGFERIAAFIDEHPDWPGQDTLLRRAEEALDSSIADQRVLDWFSERQPITGEGHVRLGETMLRAGRGPSGGELVRQGWIVGNFSPRDEADIRRRHQSLLTAADHAARLDRLLWERDVAAARRMLSLVEPGRRALAEARIALIGRSGNVDKLMARIPPELADDSGLNFDRMRWRRGRGRVSASGIEDILANIAEDTDRADKWWTERHFRARKALAEGRFVDAYRLAANHGPLDPRSLAEAEWLAGWIALRFIGDVPGAELHFQRLHGAVRFPVSQARGAYWIGRAAQAAGDQTRAAIWFGEAARHPTTYYAQLALVALGKREPLVLPTDPRPTEEQIVAFAARDLARAVRLMAELEQPDRLRVFIMRLQELAQTTEEHALVASLARELGRIDLAVATSKRSAQTGIALIGDSFPLVEPLASAARPEPALVLAVARQESEFNQFAVSLAGARGLMQLMPATAREVARLMQLRHQNDRLTADARYNTLLGSRYLGALLESWDGNYPLALAAYNAGDGRVRRWIKEWGDPRRAEVDPVDWVELIPITETRNYVQRVIEAVQVYRQLLRPTSSIGLRLDMDMRGNSSRL